MSLFFGVMAISSQWQILIPWPAFDYPVAWRM